MTEAIQTAIRLLKDTAQELAEGISVLGVPDLEGEPDTAAEYDRIQDAIFEIEAHQAEHLALQRGYDAARMEIENLRAQAAPAAVAVPDGWVLVPVEPTPEIINAARDAGFHFQDEGFGPDVLHTDGIQYSLRCFERFAAMVAASERKSIAAHYDSMPYEEFFGREIGDAIRARGDHAG